MNTMPTTPAVCEIDNCGVLAVGRCTTCKRAFCVSHQARESNSSFTYANMCTSCFAKTPREVERAQKDKYIAEVQAAQGYLLGPALNALLAAKVPTVEIFQVEQKLKRGFFGDRWVDVVTPRGHGWVLQADQSKCVLMTTPDPMSSIPRVYAVKPYAGGYALDGRKTMNGGYDSVSLDTMLAAAKAVKRLVGEPD